MFFRAYLTQFSDSTDASWSDIKYAGRGERFYIYDGFTRKIQIGFKVAALSAVEMEPMYKKLNFLMSNLMPDYGGNIYMKGPLVKMTVGNWIENQTGILNSLSYTIPNDSPWEINENENKFGNYPKVFTQDEIQQAAGAIPPDVTIVQPKVLPHIIEVNMSFTPIGGLGGALPEKGASELIGQSNE